MAFSTASLGPRRGPMSLDEIMKEAEVMLGEYNAAVPLRVWLRSADAIQKQAQSYDRDGNEEEAYKFYWRHATLVMSRLAQHPDLKIPENKIAWKKVQADVHDNLSKMEILKPKIKARYEAWLERQKQIREQQERWQKAPRTDATTSISGKLNNLSLSSPHSSFAYGEALELDPSKNHDLAVKLAVKAKRENRFSKVLPHPQSYLYRSSDRSSKQSATSFYNDDSDEDLSKNLIAFGQRRQEAYSRPKSTQQQRPEAKRTSADSRAPQYPNVPKHSNLDYLTQLEPQPRNSPPSLAPRLPPKYFDDTDQQPHYDTSLIPPPIPQKLRTPSPPPGVIEAPDTSSSALDANKYSFTTTAKTESGKPLRTVFINPKLRNRFLTIALSNTQDNLETCGILCGDLKANAFFITTLLIPEQEATSDTCDTVNEGALFDYCDKENLMTLGWIHTHPTQTCFMSSRDLHTHGGYQVQLPESIAIVCAPRHEPSWGIFRLTDPPGLSAILNCKQTGVFHPHAETHVYTNALQPGHVREIENLPFDVVDLRPGKTWL